MNKACIKCRKVQDIGQFHRNKSTVSGVIGTCKSCIRKAYEDRGDLKILPIILKVRAHDRDYGTNLTGAIMRVTLDHKVKVYEI